MMNLKRSSFSSLVCAFFALFAMSSTLNAQNFTPATDAEIRQATEALTAKYALNADQAKQMYQIQQRKNKNLSQIAALQTSDPALYRAKLKNVQEGTWASIRRILNNKAQVDLYRKTQSDLRNERNAKRKELFAQKAQNEAIELAMLAIYAE
ncbi:MAG: hypothetical protein JNJ57_06520 [Saprospiraceae bacterium]|nr:hypothetical protein [Saprospiraceae bacterium]